MPKKTNANTEPTPQEWLAKHDIRKTIPNDVKLQLAAASGGFCQFRGCPKYLLEDPSTFSLLNTANIAHIHAVSPEGPRFDALKSPEGETAFWNLMLMCYDHHHLVDTRRDDYSTTTLFEMKSQHEQGLRSFLENTERHRTHVVILRAPTGPESPPVTAEAAKTVVMRHEHWPATREPINLTFDIPYQDHEDEYWRRLIADLDKTFKQRYQLHLENSPHEHVSVFAVAPVPLLVKLGNLIGSQRPADIYLLNNGKQHWGYRAHQDTDPMPEITTRPSKTITRVKNIILCIELSVSVDLKKAKRATSAGAPIYCIGFPGIIVPRTLKTALQKDKFLELFREVIEEITARFGDDVTIHLFPAVPNSVAVELGKLYRSKWHPQMHVYEHNRRLNAHRLAVTLID